MISKTQTRKCLKNVLTSLKKDGIKIKYPMTEFRHAIFNTVDMSRSLIFHSWTFDTTREYTICNLFFKTKKIECAYDYKKKIVFVNVYDVKDDCETLIQVTKVTCDELPAFVHQYQPKVKIVRKK